MNTDALYLLIRQKLIDGRLPYESPERLWGGHGRNEVCDACDAPVVRSQLVMEAVSAKVAARIVQFHVGCFRAWDTVRNAWPAHG